MSRSRVISLNQFHIVYKAIIATQQATRHRGRVKNKRDIESSRKLSATGFASAHIAKTLLKKKPQPLNLAYAEEIQAHRMRLHQKAKTIED